MDLGEALDKFVKDKDSGKVYIAVQTDSLRSLNYVVDHIIRKERFLPQGGVAHCDGRYTQAMIAPSIWNR